jgi:hypothetical protein
VPAKLKTDKVAEAVTPIVTRVANDPELREHALRALDSARVVYGRVQREGARNAAMRREVQEEVLAAVAELRTGAGKLMDPPRQKSHKFLKFMVAGLIATVAVIGIKQALSSDEDEFEYTP